MAQKIPPASLVNGVPFLRMGPDLPNSRQGAKLVEAAFPAGKQGPSFHNSRTILGRHGPRLSQPIAGDVIGFALEWEGQEHGVFWVSGDTVLYDGVRQVADRLEVDTVLLHVGAVRFPITGPVHYTLTAKEAVELCSLIRPRTIVPVHYEGWKHFSQGRAEVEEAFARAPDELRRAVRWLPIGREVELAS